MPRAVAESLIHRLIDSFPPRRAYAAAAFEREPMPAPVAHFLKHWLRHRLRHEATRLEGPRSDWFDLEHEAVQHARQGLTQALIDHGHFPAAVWEASLREAVQQVTAYLVRPASTLATFVFQENNGAVSAEVLTWRLGYFKDYSYFHQAMRLYLEEQAGKEVEQDRFAKLVRTIDRKITKDYDAEAWLTLLAPLFDLARRAGAGPGVPVRLLTAFFEDKDAEIILTRLARSPQHRDLETLDEDALRSLLEDVDEPAPAPTLPPAAFDPAPGPVPRWKQFQAQQATPPSPAPVVKPQPRRGFSHTPDDARPSTPAQDARPRWMQFRADGQPEASASLPPSRPAPADLARIEHAVLGEAGATHRDLFINALFARSLEAYERVLRQLFATPNWADASKIIADEVFRTFQVNIYSDPAILFTDTVEARYLERKT